MQPSSDWLVLEDLGRLDYATALEHQRKRHREVLEARTEDVPKGFLLLLEHVPPVLTVSRRPGAKEHVLADNQRLETLGIQQVQTDRGGDVTYHGPGQLVVYPILDLNLLRLRIHGYIRLLEQAAIDTCAQCGVAAVRDPEATGVWVGRTENDGGRKIGAIGVRVSRWVTMHGLSLNVAPNLGHYDVIVPCGLHGRGVTSLEEELSGTCPSMDEVKVVLESRFRALMDDPTEFREARSR